MSIKEAIRSPEYAEAIYHFCQQATIYSELEIRVQQEDLSLVEFVALYHSEDFKKYLVDTLGVELK